MEIRHAALPVDWDRDFGAHGVGAAGCDGGVPPSGRAPVTPVDLLEKQRTKLVEMKSQMKARPSAKPGARR